MTRHTFAQRFILLFLLLSFLGCAAPGKQKEDQKPGKKKAVSQKAEKRVIGSSVFPDEGNEFYLFLESQFSRIKDDSEKATDYLSRALQKDPTSLFLKEQLVNSYLRAKENKKALALLRSLIDEDPDNPEYLGLTGRVLQETGDMEEAKKAFEEAVEKDPGQRKIYITLGKMFYDEGDFDNALRIYTQLVTNFPDSFTGHFFMGKILAKKQKYKEAEAEFKKCMDLRPNLEEPEFEIIDLYKARGLKKKAIGMYKDILEDNPDDIRASAELGFYYHKIGRKKKAEDIFTELGKRSIFDTEIMRTVVELYVKSRRYEDAVIVLEGMLNGAPENSDIHYIIGFASDNLKNDEKALKHFLMVKPDSGFYENAAVSASFLYQELGRLEKAVEFLKGVINNVPDNSAFLLYLGSFYDEMGKYHEAVEAYKKGLIIEPENEKLYFRMGVVYDRWGKKEDSISAMKKLLEINPKHANALNYLGYTYADMGKKLDEAEELIKKAMQYKKNDGYITDSLGWVYYQKGMFEEALKYLKIAVGLVPDDPIILQHVGDVYFKLEYYEKAMEFYGKSLKRQDKEKEIKYLKERIRQLREKGVGE